jgi:hypothetical protein
LILFSFFFSGLKLKTIILNGTIPMVEAVNMCRVKTFINSGIGLLFFIGSIQLFK